MKITVLAVGKTRPPLATAIDEYEARIRRYFAFEAVEVKEASARRGTGIGRVMAQEGERLLARVPPAAEIVALDRLGRQWSSEELAETLSAAALRASPGVAFLIGGAYGLSPEVLSRASHSLSLSAMTLPHEMARLVLSEQIYRAGTIQRGEPYHKGPRT